MVENRFSQERIFVQELWSRYEKWSSLVTLNGSKIVLDTKSTFLTNLVKFPIVVKWIFLYEKRKKWGFFEKKSKIFMNIDCIENLSLWIENWCLGGHFKPLSIFESNLNEKWVFCFFPIFEYSMIFSFKVSSEQIWFFFQTSLEWPPDAQIMYTKLS